MRVFSVLLFISILLLTGCSSQAVQNKPEQNSLYSEEERQTWKASETFTVGNKTYIGIPGKVGIFPYPPPFNKGTNKYMWFFKGDPEIFKKHFKVVGTHQKTGKSEVLINQEGGATPFEWADAHFPSTMTFDETGLWKLDIYFGEKKFESIVVEITE